MGKGNDKRGCKGNGNGKGRGSRQGSKKSNNSKGGSKSSTEKKKTLNDYVYYLGSSQQADNYVTVTTYITNYIKRTIDGSEDVTNAMDALTEMDFDAIKPKLAPVPPPSLKELTKVERQAEQQELRRQERQADMIFKVEMEAHRTRLTRYKEVMSRADGIIWSQCHPNMKSKIQSRPEYEGSIKGNAI